MQRNPAFPARPLLAALAVLALALIVGLAGCAPAAPEVAAVPPTKTPKPTFTPTVAVTPTPLVLPTATAAPTATAVPASPTPAATATPQGAELSASQNANVRLGPGTNYQVIGQLRARDTKKIVAKNDDGSWFQFNYQGDPGWVSATMVTTTGDVDALKVAQNVPEAPVAVAQPVAVQPAPVQAQPAAPAPTAAPAAPACSYKYCNGNESDCLPNQAGTWISGKIYYNGQLTDGERVVFSGGGVDGGWASDPVISGPHTGYPGWEHGYFEHVLSANGPRAGAWTVWIVDANKNRISKAVTVQTDGHLPVGQGCSMVHLKFSN